MHPGESHHTVVIMEALRLNNAAYENLLAAISVLEGCHSGPGEHP